MKALLSFAFASLLYADTLVTGIFHPAQMGTFTPLPQPLEIKSRTVVSLSETNDYEKEPPYYHLDYELTTLLILKEIPLNATSSMTMILPLHRFWGGFMDDPLDSFHNATGTLHGYRHNEEGKNRLLIDYGPIHQRGSFATLGDAQIYYKKRLGSYAIVASLKLPLHTKSKFFGSKKLAFGAGAIYKKGPLTLNLHITYNPKVTLAYATTKKLRYFAIASYRYGRWLAEYRFGSSPFHSKVPQFDSISNTLSLAYSLGAWRFFISENLAPFYNTPDFTIGVNYRF